MNNSIIAKDGFRIIYYTAIILILLLLLSYLLDNGILYILSGVTAVVFIFHFFFFRDPERPIPDNENLVLSPADGQIIKIQEINEPEYCKDTVQLVSIFMSVFNVHVNRMPVSGKVELLDYKKGRFLAAYADEAMEHNEQSIIGIRSSKGKIMFKQIAGLIARRIVCRAKEGDEYRAGQRFGMIKYSSRVDLYLPQNVKLKVKLKDKVKGGMSIIGEYKS